MVDSRTLNSFFFLEKNIRAFEAQFGQVNKERVKCGGRDYKIEHGRKRKDGAKKETN